METDNKELYYKSLSKYRLVELMRQRGTYKYIYSMTKPEIVKRLCEMDMMKEKVCECKCQKFICDERTRGDVI